MNGSSSARCFSITRGYGVPPEITLICSDRMPSIAKNASGIEIRRLAESSSVRSNHCVAAVIAGFSVSTITYRASDAMRSERIGLRLYAIADDPICLDSNGSSNSLRWLSSRISPANLDALCAMPDSTDSTK